MPNKLSSPKLYKLKVRKKQLEAQIVNTENRVKSNRSKQETRKKILIGSYFKRKFANDGEWEKLIDLIDSFLIRPYDRFIFGLPESPGDQIKSDMLTSDLDLPLKGTILIGAFFMDHYKEDQDSLLKLMDPFLNRPIDRKLFGLDIQNSKTEGIPF